MKPVHSAVHPSIPRSSSSGAFHDIRFDEELDEQAQIRAKEAAPEQRRVFWPRAIGGLRQEGWEAVVVTCLEYVQISLWVSQKVVR